MDNLIDQVAILKRKVVMERAQVIYYTERAIAFRERTTMDLSMGDFKDLPEELLAGYVTRSIIELQGDDEPETKTIKIMQ
jgi:hypothetical protein